MRLPNGFGGIAKLSGKRRNPWRARITSGWEIDEKTQKVKQVYTTIGYYPTRQLALQALSDYNTNPYDLDAGRMRRCCKYLRRIFAMEAGTFFGW